MDNDYWLPVGRDEGFLGEVDDAAYFRGKLFEGLTASSPGVTDDTARRLDQMERRLRLLEDAMVIYREKRATRQIQAVNADGQITDECWEALRTTPEDGERRVYYLDVSQVDGVTAEELMARLKRAFKEKRVEDPSKEDR